MKTKYCGKCGKEMAVTITPHSEGYYTETGEPWKVFKVVYKCPNYSRWLGSHTAIEDYVEGRDLNEN